MQNKLYPKKEFKIFICVKKMNINILIVNFVTEKHFFYCDKKIVIDYLVQFLERV